MFIAKVEVYLNLFCGDKICINKIFKNRFSKIMVDGKEILLLHLTLVIAQHVTLAIAQHVISVTARQVILVKTLMNIQIVA